MVSYIFVSSNSELGIAAIKQNCEQVHISVLDQLNLELEIGEKTAISLGIADIKKLFQKIYLKPIRSPNKAFIIHDAQTLTPEAQNALLKLLEELPANTYIYLLTTSLNSILPTIQSRCSIFNLEAEEANQSESKITVPTNIGERLVLAEKNGKQKTTAVPFLQNLLITYHSKLHTDDDKKHLLGEIREIEKSLKLLQTTNVNPRLTLEHVLLNLS